MKKIKINTPCHEKWTEFTPTQQGGFCKTCAVDVIDFSKKSNLEIQTILVSNANKSICGRFKKSQLDTYNSEYHIWQNQTNSTFQSKFIFSLILGFGLTLFSCSSPADQQSIEHITSIVTQIDTLEKSTIAIDSVKTIDSPLQAIPINADILGDIEEFYPDEEVLGEIEEEMINKNQFIKGKVALIKEDTTTDNQLKDQIMTMGMIAPPILKEKIIKIDSI